MAARDTAAAELVRLEQTEGPAAISGADELREHRKKLGEAALRRDVADALAKQAASDAAKVRAACRLHSPRVNGLSQMPAELLQCGGCCSEVPTGGSKSVNAEAHRLVSVEGATRNSLDLALKF